MSNLNVIIATVACGGWYPRGASRLIAEFERSSPGYQIKAWINALPPGAPAELVEDGVDYTAYAAKPFALKACMSAGADVGILLDAAFYPIRHIQPLVDHICGTGYFLCKNGAWVGEWTNDRMLAYYGITRDEAMKIEEVSSYCVGLDFRDMRSMELLRRWCTDARTGFFAGPHTNIGVHALGRNVGWCSNDPRCKGHRHDQSAASLIAHDLGMNVLVERPAFTAYLGHEDERTVLINHGGI